MIATIFDTETSGLIPCGLVDDKIKPQVIEFAAIKTNLDTKEEVTRYDFLVKPTISISKEITNITGIDDEKVKDAKSFAAHINEIRDALENCDAVIAHNASFDKEMIDIEAARCGIKIKWPDRIICTVEQTTCLKGYRLTLSDLHQTLFGFTFEGAHRAMHDVEALAKCVDNLNTQGYF